MEIQSDKEGLSVTCRNLWIRSGAILTADRLKITCQSVTIEQSGIIDLSYKVSLCYFVIYIKVFFEGKELIAGHCFTSRPCFPFYLFTPECLNLV